MDFVDPIIYGCICDGISDDTINFQRAIKVAGILNVPLRLPPKNIRITDIIVVNGLGNLSIEGCGAKLSQLIIDGNINQAGLAYTGSNANYNQVILRNFGIICMGKNIVDVINLRFDEGNGMTTQSAIIENIEISLQGESSQFVRGFSLWNVRNSKFKGLRIDGNRGITLGSAGVYLDGDAQPVEFFISDCNIYNLEAGIRIVGQDEGQGLEGVYIQQSAIIACRYGIQAFTSLPSGKKVSNLFIKISGCHINCYNRNISINNFVHCLITGNLLYAAVDYPVNEDPSHEYASIELFVDVDPPRTNQFITIISSNIILGNNRNSTPLYYKVGIHVWNGSDLLITDNFFGGFEPPIWLDNPTSNITVTKTNCFPIGANVGLVKNEGMNNSVLKK